MFYRLVRRLVAFALSLFYRVEVVRRTDDLSGPVLFVGNHPNSLIDPALVFVITDRPVTFLAKEPLFRVPVFGQVLRGLGALPVYRKVDHPGQMEKNEGTLLTAAQALVDGRAITIFPEGKSHSEPQLSDIKTGCARIALRAARQGKALRIVPVGLTYENKHRFKSQVHVEVGEPILVEAVTSLEGEAEQEWVRLLTTKVGASLRAVTLNLEDWEDLSLVKTADELFALRNGYREKDPERLRLMAKGAAVLRREDSERFDELKDDIASFQARLRMVNAEASTLGASFDGRELAFFVARNLFGLVFGFPLFVLGLVLFAVPFMFIRVVSRVIWLPKDRVATLKLLGAFLMVPLWWGLLVVSAWALGGLWGGVAAALLSLPLALYTRYFIERRKAAWEDLVTFFRLGSAKKLRMHLLFEGERLQEDIQRLVEQLKPKVEPAAPP